jgi:transposase-like protein
MRSITAAEVVEDGAVRDQQGRKRTSRSRREELVAAWKRSGLSQAEFARREGVRYPTFAGWVQRARLAPESSPAVQFTEFRWPATSKEATESSPAPLEVRLPDGTIVRGADAVAVAVLVQTLRRG